MLTVTKNKPVFAQLDIFPIEPEQQQPLVDSLIDYVNYLLQLSIETSEVAS